MKTKAKAKPATVLTRDEVRQIGEYARVLSATREALIVYRQVLRRHQGCDCLLCEELRVLTHVVNRYFEGLECDAPADAVVHWAYDLGDES